MSKIFTPTTINNGENSQLIFTVANITGNPAQNGLAFTDNLPAGLVVAAAPAVSNTCGGALTANAGSATITLNGGNLTGGTTSCEITVNVTGNPVETYAKPLTSRLLKSGLAAHRRQPLAGAIERVTDVANLWRRQSLPINLFAARWTERAALLTNIAADFQIGRHITGDYDQPRKLGNGFHELPRILVSPG